ncbi:Arc-like DNA binding domain-containing protein OS=Streptomyces glaucescens OX=1907 GN=SGLAU_21685 PE=4 SV=1 [Streptomyces glaucescens]
MTDSPEGPAPRRRPRQQRKQVLLRLDPLVYEALARWAGDELRSANAQIEFLLRRALAEAGLPGEAGPIPRRGRPPRGPASDQDN